jgi:hypothetical protein
MKRTVLCLCLCVSFCGAVSGSHLAPIDTGKTKVVSPPVTSVPTQEDGCDTCESECQQIGADATVRCLREGGSVSKCGTEGLCYKAICCATRCAPCSFCVTSGGACDYWLEITGAETLRSILEAVAKQLVAKQP